MIDDVTDLAQGVKLEQAQMNTLEYRKMLTYISQHLLKRWLA
jgi:hypothetical protein